MSQSPAVDDHSAGLQLAPMSYEDTHGVQWLWRKQVTPVVMPDGPPPSPVLVVPDVSPEDYLASISEAELAAKLDPKVLRRIVATDGTVTFHEYRRATPPLAMARAILANRDQVAVREPEAGSGTPTSAAQNVPRRPDRVGRYIVNNNRWYTSGNNNNWPYRTAMGTAPQRCTASMIGAHTAISAAHCYYNDWISGGPWISTDYLLPGGDSVAPIAPFGTFLFDTIYIPGGWNHDGDWDWDFAGLDFNTALGDTLGWMGWDTADPGNSTALRMHGYPSDKAWAQIWTTNGNKFANVGARYKHNLDAMVGDSGACVYRVDTSRCIGVQSTGWFTNNGVHNEVRRFDSTFHNLVISLPHGGG